MRFHIPIKLPSLSNVRWHWRKIDNIKRKQKGQTALAMRIAMLGVPLPIKLPLVITMTRIGRQKLDDDNLASACKYVRDAIAATIGTDDGSPLYTWRCEQRTGANLEYGVDVEITPRGDGL